MKLFAQKSSLKINKTLSHEETMEKKRELLYQFDRLESRGIHVPRKFTTASDLEEMQTE